MYVDKDCTLSFPVFFFHSQFFYSHFIYCHLYCNGFEVKVYMATAAMKIKDASSLEE